MASNGNTSKSTEAGLEDVSTDKTNGNKNGGFSSTFGTYVTILGYSVGMSDFWRFPFLAYRNGGGAFLIPFTLTVLLCGLPLFFLEYTIGNFSDKVYWAFLIPFVLTVLLCGLPLFFLEYTIGNFSGKGPYKLWDICPLFRGIGVASTAAYFLYLFGSSVFRSWLIHFLMNTFKDPLPWTHCGNEWNTVTCKSSQLTGQSNYSSNFENQNGAGGSNLTFNADSFDKVTSELMKWTSPNMATDNSTVDVPRGLGMTSEEEFWQYEALSLSNGIEHVGALQWNLVIYTLVFRLAVFLCMVKSIKSIEKVSYFTTFFPLLFMVAVFIRSLTLPGAADGLAKFLSCDFRSISQPRVWIEAFLMAFYTLSFGFGTILTLGSHVRFQNNCIRACTILPLLDALWAILSGFVCFSILGNMAHALGVSVDEVINSGVSLGVVSYITALGTLPLPQLWTCLFLLSVIVTGLDSQAVPIEMTVQVLGETFPRLYPRFRTTVLLLVTVLLFLLSLPTCTQAGGYIFLWLDWYTSSLIGPISALVELIAVAWVYGIDRFSNDVMLMIGRPIPHFIRLATAFITPAIVIIILVTTLVEYVPPTYGDYFYPTWSRILGWFLVALVMSPVFVYIIKVMQGHSGSLFTKLKKSLRSTKDWKPKDKGAEKQFQQTKGAFRNRSTKDLFWFSVLGRYKNSIVNKDSEEMRAFKV